MINTLNIKKLYSVIITVDDMADCIQTSSIVLLLKDPNVPTLRIQEGLIDNLKLKMFYQLGGYATMNKNNPYQIGLKLRTIDFLTNNFNRNNTVNQTYSVEYNHETNEIQFIKESQSFDQLQILYKEQKAELSKSNMNKRKMTKIIEQLKKLPKDERQKIINEL